jgi:hypothetical protein
VSLCSVLSVESTALVTRQKSDGANLCTLLVQLALYASLHYYCMHSPCITHCTQRGYDAHATEALRRRLMRSWLVHLKAPSNSSNSNSSSDNNNSSGASSFSMSSSDLLGDGLDSSVFEPSASEVRLREDMLAALKVLVTCSTLLCRYRTCRHFYVSL